MQRRRRRRRLSAVRRNSVDVNNGPTKRPIVVNSCTSVIFRCSEAQQTLNYKVVRNSAKITRRFTRKAAKWLMQTHDRTTIMLTSYNHPYDLETFERSRSCDCRCV